jgi:DNA primase
MIPSDLIERASAVRIEDEIERRGINLVGRVDRCGPCPQWGGHDRFSVNVRKQVFLCRACGARGDVIALVRFLDGCGFLEALEYLTGERAPAPSRPAPAATDAPRDDDRDARDLIFAKSIMLGMRSIIGTPGETYLRDVRKIETRAIDDVSERIDAIGWHPSVLFRKEGHPLDGKRLGAIIAVMTDVITAAPTGAISRTYLHEGLKIGKGEDARQTRGNY